MFVSFKLCINYIWMGADDGASRICVKEAQCSNPSPALVLTRKVGRGGGAMKDY